MFKDTDKQNTNTCIYIYIIDHFNLVRWSMTKCQLLDHFLWEATPPLQGHRGTIICRSFVRQMLVILNDLAVDGRWAAWSCKCRGESKGRSPTKRWSQLDLLSWTNYIIAYIYVYLCMSKKKGVTLYIYMSIWQPHIASLWRSCSHWEKPALDREMMETCPYAKSDGVTSINSFTVHHDPRKILPEVGHLWRSWSAEAVLG